MNEAEAEDAMKSFRRKLVGHRIAIECRDLLHRKIMTADKERIVPLIGPAGVGKTAVGQRVQAMILKDKLQEMNEDPGYMPYLSVVAVTGLDGNYNWKDGFARLLAAGNEPLIAKKTSFPNLYLDGAAITTTRGLVKDDFRRTFESMVKHRRMRWLFIDEASAVIDETVNRHPLRQFNILKSLAIELNLVIVLIGAYDLLGIRSGNGQLIRRQDLVHMQRYTLSHSPPIEPSVAAGETLVANQEDTPVLSDIDEWSSSVDMLASALPEQVRLDEETLADKQSLLIRSIGCFGNFRDWLDRSAIDALVTNGGVLSAAVMKRNALSVSALLKLASEADLGEDLLVDANEGDLAKLYGVEAVESRPCDGLPVTPSRRQGSGKMGKRGPSRDPLGLTGA